MQFPASGKEASGYGRRGAAKAGIGQVYRIEGDYVGIADIAKRIGLSVPAARNRLRKLKGASGAVTWARLAA